MQIQRFSFSQPISIKITFLVLFALTAVLAVVLQSGSANLGLGVYKDVRNVFRTSAVAPTTAPGQKVPEVALEAVDTTLGQYRPTGSVLGQQNQKKTISTAAALVVTNTPCDIVLDFVQQSAQGTAFQYQLSVLNKGNGVCDEASLTIHYGDGERYVSASPTASVGGYYWKLGALGSAEQRVILLNTTNTTASVGATEGCATAHNGSDSCMTARVGTVPTPVTTITPVPTPTPTPTMTPTPTPTATPTPRATPTPVPSATPVVQTSAVRPVSQNKTYGVWVWDDVSGMSDVAMTSIVEKASQAKFDTIYLTIDKYLELQATTNSATRAVLVGAYGDSLAQFIAKANAKGIAVYAEAGWKDWAESGKRGKAISILNYVASFNAARNTKFAGVQYDIEPYLLSTYEKNKATVLANYVNHVAEIVAANQALGLTLEFVIPHFYDCAQKWTPNITYGGKSDCTFNHLLTILDKSPNSTISIMAYRNFADGNNGVTKLVSEELKQALGRPTKIIIAQETGDVDPAYVTYHATSKQYMFSEIAKVLNSVGSMNSFAGIAMHYIDPFTELE